MKELRDTHKQDTKTQTNLLKFIDNLTNQVADLTTQNRMISKRIAELAQTLLRKMNINKTLQQKINDLLSQISVGNKVR